MIKSERVKLVRQMLHALGEEERRGGFSEYTQFCEEGLSYLLDNLDESGLKFLMEQIEHTSSLGLNRRQKSVLNDFNGDRGVW